MSDIGPELREGGRTRKRGVQLNAEALSALAWTQVLRKGCPAIYGHYLSTALMVSGAPMAGTPEISLMNFMSGQVARFHDVSWRTSNALGGAKTFDAQAGCESVSTMMALLLLGANYLWHSLSFPNDFQIQRV